MLSLINVVLDVLKVKAVIDIVLDLVLNVGLEVVLKDFFQDVLQNVPKFFLDIVLVILLSFIFGLKVSLKSLGWGGVGGLNSFSCLFRLHKWVQLM